MRKTIFDDGFHSYLTEGATLVGDAGIPMMLDLKNTQVPKGLLPFEKIHSKKYDKRRYLHFYMHDKYFAKVLTATKKYVDEFKLYDGVISPDFSLLVGQAKCLQETNTYFNRGIGFYLQTQGIPVIPNIRWSDCSSYEFCFLGVPKNSIVAVSTHGCIRSRKKKELFKSGLEEMIRQLSPTDVVVHGYMPDSVFSDYKKETRFHRFPSLFEETHMREVK